MIEGSSANIFVRACVHGVQEALDVWSLGVMAFELLTGQPALRMHEGKDKAPPPLFLSNVSAILPHSVHCSGQLSIVPAWHRQARASSLHHDAYEMLCCAVLHACTCRQLE